MQLSPVLANLAQYPFARLDDWKAEAQGRGIDLIDFGMGDPREVTPAFIREALLQSVAEVSSYPRAPGLPELREAIAGWIGRRHARQRKRDAARRDQPRELPSRRTHHRGQADSSSRRSSAGALPASASQIRMTPMWPSRPSC